MGGKKKKRKIKKRGREKLEGKKKKKRQEKKKVKSYPKSEEADTSDKVGAETDSGDVFSFVVVVGHAGN